MPYTHEGRVASLSTPLGDDVLLLSRLEGSEGLSQLFRFEAELLTEGEPIDPAQVVGQNVTVALDLENGDRRYLNGMVSRLGQGPSDERFISYRATIVPFVWLLTRRQDCRVYQNLSVKGLAEQVLDELGVKDYELRLSGEPPEREYVVQYRESYWDFLSRLLEDEGLFYFFEHGDGKHTLVIADPSWQPEPFGSPPQVAYEGNGASAAAPEAISDWQIERVVRPGLFTLSTFDFQQPRLDLQASAQGSEYPVESELEVYESLPAAYDSVKRGEDLAEVRLEEAVSGGIVIQGRSRNRALRVASTFELAGHYDPAFDGQKFLIRAQELRLDQSDSFQPAAAGGSIFESVFTCLPATVRFRPPRVTPRPRIVGPQTATVVGPENEEIHADAHGRVRVQFHWDRLGPADDSSSCPVRVSQAWAGKGFGTLHLPRIGQEVVVEFLEGDPDQPLITGSVYNGVLKPPYDPSAHPTITTWKSSTSKGGQGFNEIRFDDKKKKEQVFLHAQKDLHQRVLNDRLEWVGRDRHRQVVRNEKTKVEGDRHDDVVGDRLERVGANANLDVAGDRMVQVQGADHEKVDGDANREVGGALSFQVTGDLLGKADGNVAFDGSNLHLKAGTNTVIEASTQLTLKVGGNFIVISAAGIDIQGTMLKLNSGGSPGSGAGCSPGTAAAPDPPEAPLEATQGDPGEVSEAEAEPEEVAGFPSGSTPAASKQAQVLAEAAETGAPFCEKCEEAKRRSGEQE